MDSTTALLLAGAAGIGIYLYTQKPKSNDSLYAPTIVVSTTPTKPPAPVPVFYPEPIAPPPPPTTVYAPEPVGRLTSQPRNDTMPVGALRNFTKGPMVPPFIAFDGPSRGFARI